MIRFYIYLVSLPSKVKSITIFRKQTFLEGQIHYENENKFDTKNMNWGWTDSEAKQSATNFHKYNKLTFQLESELLAVEDIDGNDITNNYLKFTQVKVFDTKMDTYIWEIVDHSLLKKMKSANNKQMFRSAIFSLGGFRWYFKCYPNGNTSKLKGDVNLFIYLALLPSELQSITCRTTLEFVEGKKSSLNALRLSENKMCRGWAAGIMKTEKLKNYKQFSFKFGLELLSIEDINGKDITSKYLQQSTPINDEKKQQSIYNLNNQTQNANTKTIDKLKIHEDRLDSMSDQIQQLTKNVNIIQNTLKDIKLQMNEENKANDNNNNMQNEINKLKNQMNSLLSKQENKNNKMDKEQKEFKDWIEKKVKLGQYYKIFVENGIDTLDVVTLVTANELTQMDINILGHRMKILKEIAKLVARSKQVAQEGNVLVDTNQ